MASKNFIHLIPSDLRDNLRAEFRGLDGQKDALYNAAEASFGRENVDLFIELLHDNNFEIYIRRRKTTSPTRFENQLERLFDRVMMEIPIPIVAQTAAEMASNDYIKTERIFFLRKDNHQLLVEYEKNFRRIMEQNYSLKNYYFKFVIERHFLDCIETENEVAHFLFEKITDYLLACRNPKMVLELCANLLQEAVLRFGNVSIKYESWKKYYFETLSILAKPELAKNYTRAIEIYSKRYSQAKKIGIQEKNLLDNLLSLNPFLLTLKNEDQFKVWKLFLIEFGNFKDEFQFFVWCEVFQLPLSKVYTAMDILTSNAFSKLTGFYANNTSVLKFLIRSIITSIQDIKMRNLDPTTYKFILKLFLNQKVDTEFLKRRAFFFHILREYTHSKYIELEMIRYLFFEYLFIGTGVVPNYASGMTKFCDDSHRVFCDWVDGSYLEALRLAPPDRVKFFTPVFEYFRSVIWNPATVKFAKYKYRFEQFQSAAVSSGWEDYAIEQLEILGADEFPPYYESFFEVFYTKPENAQNAIAADYWYRLPLEVARPYIQSVLLSLVGTINLAAGQSGAYTDGKTVYLPEYQNYFKDPLLPIEENRNLTLYIGFAFHECGHILAGTFRFNLDYYLRTLEKPHLFKYIMNVFEDHRIESFLVQMNTFTQVQEILRTLNEFLSIRNWKLEIPFFQVFLMYCYDEANGYDEILQKFPDFTKRLSEMLNNTVNTGRFAGLKEFKEYIVERLKNLNIGNPFSAYELSREVYEIMKHWLIEDEYQKPAKGMHEYSEELGGDGDSPVPVSVLSDTDLRELYQLYNQNPQAFVQQYNLPNVTEIHSPGTDKDGKGISKKDISKSEWILDSEMNLSYEEAGTIDFSHRTKADDMSAEGMITQNNMIPSSFGKPRVKRKKKKIVYSIDPKTHSRTKLNQIREFSITKTNHDFLKKMRRWDFIRHTILNELSRLEIHTKETHDLSAVEGEINMELLLEIISGSNKVGSFEFLDIYTENHKSLEVVIGLDASGSTALNASADYMVIDVEKAFAMIFGEALGVFTPNIEYLAFDSMSSTNVYRAVTLRNVSAIEPGNGNRDGDFIRYVTDELHRSTCELKYFFFLSDGQPNSDNYTGKEALDDTLIALREAKNTGIRVIYFNIDSEKKEYFDLFSKETSYAQHFSNPMDLIPVIPELIRSMARAVS